MLAKNTMLSHITLNMMDWSLVLNEHEHEYDVEALCEALMEVTIRNQLYLESQIEAIQHGLLLFCGFPDGLSRNVLEFVYPNGHSLCVQVVMNSDEETNQLMMDRFNEKLLTLKQSLGVYSMRRDLKFKISKSFVCKLYFQSLTFMRKNEGI